MADDLKNFTQKSKCDFVNSEDDIYIKEKTKNIKPEIKQKCINECEKLKTCDAGFDYSTINKYLVLAVKELIAKVETLENEVKLLKNK